MEDIGRNAIIHCGECFAAQRRPRLRLRTAHDVVEVAKDVLSGGSEAKLVGLLAHTGAGDSEPREGVNGIELETCRPPHGHGVADCLHDFRPVDCVERCEHDGEATPGLEGGDEVVRGQAPVIEAPGVCTWSCPVWLESADDRPRTSKAEQLVVRVEIRGVHDWPGDLTLLGRPGREGFDGGISDASLGGRAEQHRRDRGVPVLEGETICDVADASDIPAGEVHAVEGHQNASSVKLF